VKPWGPSSLRTSSQIEKHLGYQQPCPFRLCLYGGDYLCDRTSAKVLCRSDPNRARLSHIIVVRYTSGDVLATQQNRNSAVQNFSTQDRDRGRVNLAFEAKSGSRSASSGLDLLPHGHPEVRRGSTDFRSHGSRGHAEPRERGC